MERKNKELKQLAMSNASGGGHVAADLFQRVSSLERSLREKDDELARLRGHIKVKNSPLQIVLLYVEV